MTQVATIKSLAGTGSLNQAVLDLLLTQVSALESHAMREPDPDEHQAADALDRAMKLAAEGLDIIEDAQREAPTEQNESEGTSALQPWVKARNAMRLRIEEAQKGVQAEKKEVDGEIRVTNKSLVEYGNKIKEHQVEVAKVEHLYGAARIDSERFELIQSMVARLQCQKEFHSKKQEDLRLEMQREDDRKKTVKKDATETQKRCQDLQHQLTEYERRLQKRFNNNVSPEDVLALRQTCARQHEDIIVSRVTGNLPQPTGPYGSPPGKGANTLAKSISSYWEQLQEAQSTLLLEHAGSSIVDLTDPIVAKITVEDQRHRLDAIAAKSIDLNTGTRGLMRELAGMDEQSAGFCSRFPSVAMTRYLKAVTAAASRGPMAKVIIPAPTKLKSNLIVPIMADLNQMHKIHGAVF